MSTVPASTISIAVHLQKDYNTTKPSSKLLRSSLQNTLPSSINPRSHRQNQKERNGMQSINKSKRSNEEGNTTCKGVRRIKVLAKAITGHFP